jgi:hypothetical protein
MTVNFRLHEGAVLSLPHNGIVASHSSQDVDDFQRLFDVLHDNEGVLMVSSSLRAVSLTLDYTSRTSLLTWLRPKHLSSVKLQKRGKGTCSRLFCACATALHSRLHTTRGTRVRDLVEAECRTAYEELRVWRPPSSGIWRRVALVRTDLCKEMYFFHHQGKKNRWNRNNVGSN